MNQTVVWAIVVIIILLGGGWWWYTNNQSAQLSGEATEEMDGGDPQMMDSNYSENDPAMTGTWQSTQDAKYTRTFNTNGTVTDAYEGEPSATQTGEYYTILDVGAESGIPVPAASLSGMTVIKINWPEGPMYFGINSMTESELTMTPLGAAGVLTFTKVR